MSAALPVYNDSNFRAQFPAFADPKAYPLAALQFAWSMGANWLNQKVSASWGLGASVSTQWQQAADLMAAVIVYQLYGPSAVGASGPTPSQTGEAPGAVSSATEGSVSASFQLPEIGSSAFRSMLLASPPYGRMLLALLRVSASVSPYIGSGRFPNTLPP